MNAKQGRRKRRVRSAMGAIERAQREVDAFYRMVPASVFEEMQRTAENAWSIQRQFETQQREMEEFLGHSMCWNTPGAAFAEAILDSGRAAMSFCANGSLFDNRSAVSVDIHEPILGKAAQWEFSHAADIAARFNSMAASEAAQAVTWSKSLVDAFQWGSVDKNLISMASAAVQAWSMEDSRPRFLPTPSVDSTRIPSLAIDTGLGVYGSTVPPQNPIRQ